MKKLITGMTLSLALTACSAVPAMAYSVSEDTDGQSPYSIALETCEDRGGLASFSVTDDGASFTCGNDLSREYTISQ